MREFDERRQTSRTHQFPHPYHNTRSDPDAGADGCAEGSESRPCAGAVILWERALLAWGMKISLGEPAQAGKTRKGDLMRRQTRTSCAPAAAALPPWPQAAAAGLNRQRARHKAASFMRNRPTPSGSPESPRAAGRSPRLQTAGRPGAQRTRSELSAACCRRRAGSAQVSPLILRPVGGTCAAAAACAPDCRGRWSAGQGRGTAAGCACAEVRRAQRLPAGRGGAAGSPRGPSRILAPRPHAARGAVPDGRVFRAAQQARIRCRKVGAPSAVAVQSGRGVTATT